MTDNSPQLQFLLQKVSERFGGRLQTTTDFDALADSIENILHQHISPSTLKRLWGYVNERRRPRMSTLNLLASYAGRKDYGEVCREYREASGFISADRLDASSLSPGDMVQLGWMPDRRVKIVYLGGGRFRVLDAGGSKLMAGDEFTAVCFLKGHPMYLDAINRNGELLPPYVAGRSAGLTDVERCR